VLVAMLAMAVKAVCVVVVVLHQANRVAVVEVVVHR